MIFVMCYQGIQKQGHAGRDYCSKKEPGNYNKNKQDE